MVSLQFQSVGRVKAGVFVQRDHREDVERSLIQHNGSFLIRSGPVGTGPFFWARFGNDAGRIVLVDQAFRNSVAKYLTHECAEHVWPLPADLARRLSMHAGHKCSGDRVSRCMAERMQEVGALSIVLLGTVGQIVKVFGLKIDSNQPAKRSRLRVCTLRVSATTAIRAHSIKNSADPSGVFCRSILWPVARW